MSTLRRHMELRSMHHRTAMLALMLATALRPSILRAQVPSMPSSVPQTPTPLQSISSQFNPSQAITAPPDQAPVSGPIGVGDLLSIQVFDVPELTRRARVDEKGNISLPFIDTVHVTDMTSTELETFLTNWLVANRYVKAPIVAVQILESVNRGVTVIGEVVHPGIYPVYGTRTLADAIAMAQGLTSLAGGYAAVIPSGSGEGVAKVYPIRRMNGDQAPTLVTVRPGDTVIVRKIAFVYVLGSVTRPGGFPISGAQMTVLDAVALAEGPTLTAKLDKALVLHRRDGAVVSEIVPIKAMLQGKLQALPVAPDDVIYLPNDQTRTVLLNSIPSVLSAAVSAMIYGLYQNR